MLSNLAHNAMTTLADIYVTMGDIWKSRNIVLIFRYNIPVALQSNNVFNIVLHNMIYTFLGKSYKNHVVQDCIFYILFD